MSQTHIYNGLTGRRNFLKVAGAAAALLPMTEFASAADKHSHDKKAAKSRGTEKKDAPGAKTLLATESLRDLWLGHIFWVRNVSLAAIDNNAAALKASESQAVANAQLIAASIEPFYGAAAKEGFFKLLAGHYGAVKAYLLATVGDNATAQTTATQSLTSNAEELAVFLSKANPYLPKDAVQSLLLAHGGHHIQQIQQLKAHDYASEAKTWESMKNHVYQIADATADALTKQFPEKFR